MELKKQYIHMNRSKGRVTTQLTLDADFNLPEQKPDMQEIMMQQATLTAEAVKLEEGRAVVKGSLAFVLLYRPESEEKTVPEQFAGTIPFEEQLYFDGLVPQDTLQIRSELEDLTIALVNSRKLRANAIVTLEGLAETLYDEEAAAGVSGAEGMQVLTEADTVLQLAAQLRDHFRIKEDIELSGNQPNIRQLLWHQLQLQNVECRASDEKLNLRGELVLFVIYTGEEEHIPLQWLERAIPFEGEVACRDCTAEMIVLPRILLGHHEVEERPDYDGENRLLHVDAVLDLEARVYGEAQVTLVTDLYQPGMRVALQTRDAYFKKLLVKNLAKCKLVDQVHLDSQEKVLQICHSSGTVKVDSMEQGTDTLHLEGALCLTLLYLSANDRAPMRSFTGAIPFFHEIETRGISADCTYEVTPGIEQLTTVMLGNDEIEVRATLTFDTLVQCQLKRCPVSHVQTEALTPEEAEGIPGIIGYIARSGDSMWSVAKRFNTTPAAIARMNPEAGLPENADPKLELHSGQRLVLLKKNEEIKLDL